MPPKRFLLSWLALGWAIVVGLAGCTVDREIDSFATAPLIDLLARPPDEVTLETRALSFGSGERTHLRRGWTEDQRNVELDVNYVWANATEASVDFDVLDVRDLQLLVKLSPFPTRRAQRIAALINGKRVGQFDPLPGFLEYRLVAPAALLRKGRNVLTFRHAALGEDRRRLAAAYVSILIGPNCLPLRPRGAPPPTRVERTGHQILVRGPAEIAYDLETPESARLALRIDSGTEPANVVGTIVDGESVSEIFRERVAPTLFRRKATRTIEADLAPWVGQSVELRLGIYPDPCASAFATVILRDAAIVSEPPASARD